MLFDGGGTLYLVLVPDPPVEFQVLDKKCWYSINTDDTDLKQVVQSLY